MNIFGWFRRLMRMCLQVVACASQGEAEAEVSVSGQAVLMVLVLCWDYSMVLTNKPSVSINHYQPL